MTSELSSVEASSGLACPFTLRVDQVAAMLNMEFPDHPIYDGVELQWFDDEDHGTGMLAFLSRRGSKQVDYYAQPGLRLDPGAYEIGSMAMANAGPNTNGSQFFIVTGDAGVSLPPQYSLFGQVTEGMEAVTAIEDDGSAQGAPSTAHTIESVEIVEN